MPRRRCPGSEREKRKRKKKKKKREREREEEEERKKEKKKNCAANTIIMKKKMCQKHTSPLLSCQK